MKRQRTSTSPPAAAHAQKSSTLPENIVADILFKLPASSLFRFRILSRKYLNLIQSPEFIAAHAGDSCRNRAGVLILAKSHFGKVASFLPPAIPNSSNSCEPLIERVKKNGFRDFFPLPFFKGYDGGGESSLSYAGSFNGLVCLIVHVSGEYWVLWNPATSQFRFAPPPIFDNDDCYYCKGKAPRTVIVGFGYDSEANDYKSVRVCWSEEEYGGGVQVEILSWVKMSWVEIQDKSFQTILTTVKGRQGNNLSFHDPPVATSNGRVYWMDPNAGMVLCFKLHDEKLEWIPAPNAAASCYILRTINVWKGSLAMLVQSVQDSLLSVWLFNEGRSSWSVSLTIPTQGSPAIPEAVWCVNGQSVFLLYINCIACDSDGGMLKLPFDYICRAFEFAETLVRIPGS